MDQIRTGGWEADEGTLSTADNGWGVSEDEEEKSKEEVGSTAPAEQAKEPDVSGTIDTSVTTSRTEASEETGPELEVPVQPTGLSVPEEIIEEEVEEEVTGDSTSSKVAWEKEAAPVRSEEVVTSSVERRTDLREEKLVSALSQLLQSSNEIEAAALISLDGLMIASALPTAVEEDRVAAMSAAILSLGERAASELGRGDLSQVFLEGDSGYVFMMSTGGKAVLTALAKKTAKLGLVFYDMKNIAKLIGEIL